jgi:hypothetical protein
MQMLSLVVGGLVTVGGGAVGVGIQLSGSPEKFWSNVKVTVGLGKSGAAPTAGPSATGPGLVPIIYKEPPAPKHGGAPRQGGPGAILGPRLRVGDWVEYRLASKTVGPGPAVPPTTMRMTVTGLTKQEITITSTMDIGGHKTELGHHSIPVSGDAAGLLERLRMARSLGAGKQPALGPDARNNRLPDHQTFTVNGKALRCWGQRTRGAMTIGGVQSKSSVTWWFTDDPAVPVVWGGLVRWTVVTESTSKELGHSVTEMGCNLVAWGRGR